ncbi:MAG: AsmA family protein [Terriglobia bacterium]|jgi:hypothetical protein
MDPRNRRRARNLSAALLLLGLAAWIVPSYFSAERYRRRLEAGLERALHRPVKFGALSLRLLPRPGFSIENAEVEEDPDFGSEPFARVDRIECDLRWQSLWRSRMEFASLRLDRPSFNLVLNAQGEWNVGKLLVQSGLTAPVGMGAGAKNPVAEERLVLEVEDARINFKVGANKKPFALTDVRARLQVDPAERQVQFRVAASPVRLDLPVPTPGPVEAEGSWAPGRDLRGPIEATLRTRGALLYDWIPIVTGRNPELYGVLDSDVRLSGSLPELTVEGESRLTQLHRWEGLPPSEPMPWVIRFRGQFVRRRGRVLVESLEASFADSHLHLSGSVDNLPATPQLDLVVALERSRLEDVLAAVRRMWPNTGAWGLMGRVDGMLAIQGPWTRRRYGGFVGARGVSLATASGSFPVSELAVRINNRGARLAPVQVTLAPHVALVAEGVLERSNPAPRYDVQLSAKSVPVHNALAFARGLGMRAFQGLDATGSATATMHLAGSAWPLARPALTARAELRAVRLLIPGLTEPLNLPHASLHIQGDEITADPVVAVLGTSVFNAKLVHRGAWRNPWKFELHANALSLEQGALWFDALGRRRPLPLLERLPGLASFTARRSAASQLFGSLNAEGRFTTPSVSYRGVTLKDFQGTFEVAGRTIRMKTARFRVGGGRGEAGGLVDFSIAPALLTASASLTGIPVQSLTSRLPGALHGARGSVNATGNFQTRGLGREELAENLAGEATLRLKDLSFGDFDPLEALARQARWGTLEPMRGPVAVRSAAITLGIRNRRLTLKSAPLELSGAALQLNGTYALGGALSLDVRADLQHLHRRWLAREDEVKPGARYAEVHLAGPLDKLVVIPQVEVSRARE